MYSVSADFITASKAPVQKWSARGTIAGVSFTGDNILSGSLSLANQCSESSDIKLGAVYIGSFSCTFVNMSISRTAWQAANIQLEIGLDVNGSTEWVPFGRYKVSEAEHTAAGVNITAYDNMTKFDKAFTITDLAADTPLNLLSFICLRCGVTLGTNDLTGFCNGSETLALQPDNDIETYRDLLYWLCQTLCAFATIDRQGRLVVRRFVKSPDDTIDYDERFGDSAFSDYTTHYTGVSVIDSQSNETKYYGAGIDDGTSLNLGENPFLQVNTSLINNILTEIQQIEYVPFSAKIMGGAQYDLGDVITQTNGIAGTSSQSIIMAYDYRFGSSYGFSGYGANPQLSTAKSKTDKQLEGLRSKIADDTMQYYEFTNPSDININEATERIVRMHYITNKKTTLVFKAEIRLTATCKDVTTSASVTVDDVEVEATYIIEGQTIPIKPTETYLDGKHLLHLVYEFETAAAVADYMEVYLKVTGGQIDILTGDCSAYLSGLGLASLEGWDGNVEVSDTFTAISIPCPTIEEYTDAVSVAVQNPLSKGLNDTFGAIAMPTITIENYTDEVEARQGWRYTYLNADYGSDVEVDEDGIMYTDEASADILTQPNEATEVNGINVTDTGATYLVSFDNGTTWKTYAGGSWVESAITTMTKALLDSLQPEDFEPVIDYVMVKATITRYTTLEAIEIY